MSKNTKELINFIAYLNCLLSLYLIGVHCNGVISVFDREGATFLTGPYYRRKSSFAHTFLTYT
jgi:hypothetical protein